jgi:Family of unknown function (DUF5681)
MNKSAWSSSMNKKGSSGNNNYVVGRGRPPLLTRWKPGQSGNPKGRPKGVKNIMTCLRNELSRKINIKQRGEIRKVNTREAIAMTIANLALKGDPKLLPLIISLDREISAAQERERLPTSTKGMTPQEAMNLFRQHLNAGRPQHGR